MSHTTTVLSRTAADTPATESRLTYVRVFASEWMKLRWLRSIIWCASLLVLLSLAGVAVIGLTTDAPPVPAAAVGSLIAEIAATLWVFMALFVALIGTFAVTSEYQSGMIRLTMSAVPARSLLFWAKLLSVALSVCVLSAVSVFGSAAVLAGFWAPTGIAEVFSGAPLVSMLITVLTLTLVGVAGFGLGTLLRASSGSITVLTVVLFGLPIVLSLVGAFGHEWAFEVSRYLPTNLSSAAAGAPLQGDGAGVWSAAAEAIGGISVWCAAAVVPAWLLFRTRSVS